MITKTLMLNCGTHAPTTYVAKKIYARQKPQEVVRAPSPPTHLYFKNCFPGTPLEFLTRTPKVWLKYTQKYTSIQ